MYIQQKPDLKNILAIQLALFNSLPVKAIPTLIRAIPSVTTLLLGIPTVVASTLEVLLKSAALYPKRVTPSIAVHGTVKVFVNHGSDAPVTPNTIAPFALKLLSILQSIQAAAPVVYVVAVCISVVYAPPAASVVVDPLFQNGMDRL